MSSWKEDRYWGTDLGLTNHSPPASPSLRTAPELPTDCIADKKGAICFARHSTPHQDDAPTSCLSLGNQSPQTNKSTRPIPPLCLRLVHTTDISAKTAFIIHTRATRLNSTHQQRSKLRGMKTKSLKWTSRTSSFNEIKYPSHRMRSSVMTIALKKGDFVLRNMRKVLYLQQLVTGGTFCTNFHKFSEKFDRFHGCVTGISIRPVLLTVRCCKRRTE